MDTIILGGGVAALSLAHFLNRKTLILEKDEQLGGLCRSYRFNGISYDVGPHIMFSKNKEILDFHTSIIETNQIRRSNQILHKGRFVKYPFENDLAALDEIERDYCLKEFLNNPYENYDAKNMLQFFLKTFGEGITRIYLQPYNEKIWKFDPAFMDTQMVERIPKPPKEDVIKSAKGIPTEGYTHQLYFHYPKRNGYQSLVDAYVKLVKGKAEFVNPVKISKIRKKGQVWNIETDKGSFQCKTLINTMPVHELFRYIEAPEEVMHSLNEMKYNSIHIIIVQAKKDSIGDHFALYIPDKEIIFHRLSKLNFLGEEYCLKDGGTTLLVEITFRPGSYIGSLGREEIRKRVLEDLEKINFVKKKDVTGVEIRSFKYAYVIYDLDHRKNTDKVLNYLSGLGIYSAGRFAEFEYMNSDKVAEHSKALAEKLNRQS